MDQEVCAAPAVDTSPVVELRRYTLHPGQRDVLMDMFERHFVAPQLALGIRLHGEFRVAGRPDEFAWVRGFPSYAERPPELGAFYGGPAWREHREAANATMVDSDNVLLLRPVGEGGFTLARRMAATMTATIYLLQSPVDAGFERFFRERVVPVVAATGAPPVAALQSLEEPNNFPKLPVREGEHAFVWFAAFANDQALARHDQALAASAAWPGVQAELGARLARPVERLVLHPTQKALDRSRAPYRFSTAQTGGVHDFDFIAGRWTVVNHRLLQRGVGANAWETVPSTSAAQLLLGGVANVDEIVFPTKGWSGLTLRHFDIASRQWSIRWINSRDGRLQAPVVGGFDGDVGLFYGDDEDEGRPVKAVFRWTRQGEANARWEQAFSYDGGATWETNWVMEFAREIS